MGREVYLRPPVQPYAVGSVRQVQFLHPDYADRENTLLILPALDAVAHNDHDHDGEGTGEDTGEGTGKDDGEDKGKGTAHSVHHGVHHETARVACCILANCRWDGYFSLSRDGPPIERGPDDILLASRYFFRLDRVHESRGHDINDDEGINRAEEVPYPVVPSFDHFRFPPSLPRSWTGALIPPSAVDKVSVRDQTCRITCSSSPNEIAHVVPAARERWWQANAMFLYTVRPDQSMNTDCPENAMLLRRDLHKLWDMHKFALVPKQGRWVVHILDNGRTTELQDNYHNIELQALQDVRAEFLLARFALAILSDMTIFVRQPLPRAVIMVKDDSREAQVRSLSGKDCYKLFGRPSKNRSHSPKKRSRSAATQDDEEMHTAWSRTQLCDAEMSDANSDGSSDEEEIRGRPQKRRRFSSSSLPDASATIPSPADTTASTAHSIPLTYKVRLNTNKQFNKI
ncbi:hypothetical protein F4859DRAFT_54853 [Xylaria cf. heliscus]|nr:hypothetical protein F4859DRAFT_54853 [Xylaria cf. heliscus]